MVGTSIGLNLLLRPKCKIEITKKEVPGLPLTVLIEEVLFRLGAFWLLGLFTNDPRILIGVSSAIFALIHISNLREVEHSSWDIPKYLLNIGVSGAMLGYFYLQYGFIFVYAAHLIYDLIVVAVHFSTRKYGGKKHGRNTRSTKRIRKV